MKPREDRVAGEFISAGRLIRQTGLIDFKLARHHSAPAEGLNVYAARRLRQVAL